MKRDVKIAIGSVVFGGLSFAVVFALLNLLTKSTPFDWKEFLFNFIGFSIVMTILSILRIRKERRKEKENL
ncbi:hypothetical protein SAMN05216480_10319 [Pustulibacterium marinum]|uniref:Uncharacterized protein n=1 Tax=Pustulibacterium marinum TaxID=1224947 RepID=A0A1I7G0L3_9FLAO|nr:hypothetical protein [Pustulibacterium marinum]SFU41861.1 hypothetical protein SAMN05216480_10319 [Pustulibacterium marinum]